MSDPLTIALLNGLLGYGIGSNRRQTQLEDRAHAEARQDELLSVQRKELAARLVAAAKTPEVLQAIAPILKRLGLPLEGTLTETPTRRMGGLETALAGMGRLQAPTELKAGPQSAMSPDLSFRFSEQTPERRQQLYDLAPGLGGGRPQNEMPPTPGGLSQPFGSAGELGGGQDELLRAVKASLAAGQVRPETGAPVAPTNPLAKSLYEERARAQAELQRKAGLEERETAATETFKKGAADRAIAGANEAMRRLGYEVIPQGINAAGEATYTLRPVQTPEFQHTNVPYPPPKRGGGRPVGGKLNDWKWYYAQAITRGDAGEAKVALGKIRQILGREPTPEELQGSEGTVGNLAGAKGRGIELGVQNLEARTAALAGKLSDAERGEIAQIHTKLQGLDKEAAKFETLPDRQKAIGSERERLHGRWDAIIKAAETRGGGAPAATEGGEAAPDHISDLLNALKHIAAMPSVEAQRAAIQRVADAAGAEPGLDRALFEQIQAIAADTGGHSREVMKARLAKAIQALEAEQAP